MRLQIVSDLHLEFAPITIRNAGADVLVLSGDICVADHLTRGIDSPYLKYAQRYLEFFKQVGDDFDQVFYVLGNHEHYSGRFERTALILESVLPKNVCLLDTAFTQYGDFRWIGGTLWTDFDRGSPLAMEQVRGGLNDYRLIKTDYRNLHPTDTYRAHGDFLDFIKQNVVENTIVLGHHAPSRRSITPAHRHGEYSYLNPGYVSDLEYFIEQYPQIRLWTHGHVHSSHDYMIGETRVFANPRGYANARNPEGFPPENYDFNPNIIVEIKS